MKKFMQILLASFALMSLVFAGCNAKKADETVDAEVDAEVGAEVAAEVMEAAGAPVVEVVTTAEVTVEDAPTETTTAQ